MPDRKRTSPDGGIERYQFSPAIVTAIRPYLTRRNVFTPVAWLFEDWAVVMGCIVTAELVRDNVPWPAFIPFYLSAIILIGGRQRGLATLLHDSTHSILNCNWSAGWQSRCLSFLIGGPLAGYAILQSWTGYHESHIRRHHDGQKFGRYGLDPDYTDEVDRGLYGDGLGRRQARRYLVGLVGPVACLNYLLYLIKYRMWPQGERRIERWARPAFVTAVAALVIALGQTELLLLYWVVPLLTTASWVGALIELAEHFPLMETQPNIDIYRTRNRLTSPGLRWILGIHNEGYHQLHHLFPSIASYYYPEVHDILKRDETYAMLNSNNGWRQIIKDIWTPEPALKAVEENDLMTDKAAFVVRDDLTPGLALNTAAHLAMQLGATFPAIRGDSVKNATGFHHSGVPVVPNVVLRADAATIKSIIAKADIMEVGFVDYPQAGFDTSTDEEFRASVALETSESIVFWGVALYADRKVVNKLIGNLKLW